jgi:hypothetical protein
MEVLLDVCLKVYTMRTLCSIHGLVHQSFNNFKTPCMQYSGYREQALLSQVGVFTLLHPVHHMLPQDKLRNGLQ